MPNDNPLAPLAPLGKAANTLVKKIADAIGMVYEPTHVVRMAKAKKQAAIIEAETEIEIEELKTEQRRYSQNRRSITTKALRQLDESADPENIETDWIVNLFDRCRLVSDDQMQTLWANILAGEANRPGSYSRRTVNLVASMDKKDADLFTALSGFCWASDSMRAPAIHQLYAREFVNGGIDYMALRHLDDIGLINLHLGNQPFAELKLPNSVTLSYFGRKLTLTHDQESIHGNGGYRLNWGAVSLTGAGEQLEPICGAVPVRGFFDYMRKEWTEHFQPAYPSQQGGKRAAKAAEGESA